MGLNAFDLRGPALNLFPVLTPLRNKLPRELSNEGDTATRWKAVTGVNLPADFQYRRRVRRKRGAEIVVNEQDFLATYAGLGLEASINMESVWTGGNVFDNKATLTKALLNSLMIAEENVILGGNTSLPLGTRQPGYLLQPGRSLRPVPSASGACAHA